MNILIDYNKVEIDDYCVNSILLLNAKGYYTSDCCSGHVKKIKSKTKECPYIGFVDCVHLPPNFPSFISEVLPYGEQKNKKAIYFDLPTNPTEDDIKNLWKRVTAWALSLPYNSNILYET